MICSAGILVYRCNGTQIEVLLAHSGGPFWAHKDTWTIPKGELEAGEDELMAAKREFAEETNVVIPDGELIDLGTAKGGSTKQNHIWAVEGDPDISGFESNLFTMEWLPKSGQSQEFPENDRVAWHDIGVAKAKVYKVQAVFLDRLADALGVRLDAPPEQQSLL